MTEREELCEYLTKTGVHFTAEEDAVLVPWDGGEKNTGYTGFVTAVEFDDKGTLTKWGAWE